MIQIKNRRVARSTIVAITVVLFAISIMVSGLSSLSGMSSSSAQSASLTQVSSGLVHYDPLDSSAGVNTSYWTFYGDAVGEGGSYTYNENTSGLYIGSSSPSSGTWAGFYAESPNENVVLYNTQLTLLYPTLTTSDGGSFNTGLYVQTYNGLINYVTCYGQASADSSTYYWGLESATGNTEEATSYTTYWTQSYPISDTQDLVQDCTIVTNGNNILMLYMNGNLVYSTDSANLQMPEPFNAYLEVESTSTNMLYGKYLDYYDTTGANLTVQNVPSGDTVEIVGTNGNVIASSATGSNDPMVAAPSIDPTLTVDSTNSLGNAITGYYTTLYTSSGSVQNSKYTPASYSLTSGADYEIQADSYDSCTFSHWEGGSISGSTADPAPISITAATTITAIYTGSSCGPQTTSSSTSETSSTTTSSSASSSSTTTISESTSPGGTVSLPIANYVMPIAGSIEVLSGSTVVASTGTVDIWGGDVYQFSGVVSIGSTTTSTITTTLTSSSSSTSSSTSTGSTSSSTTSTSASSTTQSTSSTTSSTSTSTSTSSTSTGTSSALTVDSENSLGNAITGYYTVLYTSSGSVQNDKYTPATYTLTNGADYEIEADSYGPCTFSHWEGGPISGSTADPAPISISSPITIVAVYSGSSCGPQTTTTITTTTTTTTTTSTTSTTQTTSASGTSSIEVSTVNSVGTPISGYYIALMQNGAQINSCYSQCSFTVNNGQTYQVIAESYGSETFNHWQNDGSTGAETVDVPSTSTTISLTAVYSP